MVSEKIFYVVFFPVQVYGSHWSTWCGQFGPQGLDWQDSCCGALDVATY